MSPLNFPDLVGTVYTVDIFMNNIKMENQLRPLLFLEIARKDKKKITFIEVVVGRVLKCSSKISQPYTWDYEYHRKS